MAEPTYAALPAFLAVRELRVRVRVAGFRVRVLVVVTRNGKVMADSIAYFRTVKLFFSFFVK